LLFGIFIDVIDLSKPLGDEIIALPGI
jgi:hypothetical protein